MHQETIFPHHNSPEKSEACHIYPSFLVTLLIPLSERIDGIAKVVQKRSPRTYHKPTELACAFLLECTPVALVQLSASQIMSTCCHALHEHMAPRRPHHGISGAVSRDSIMS